MGIDYLAGLDGDQLRAAKVTANAAVSAGAGSGKTRVLAARYAYLTLELGYPVESILALTFTNKAAGEMYSRIYALLLDNRDNPRARQGIADFYKARISTLDSFCAAIARTAARPYGIASSFRIDDGASQDLIRRLSLPFALDRRNNPALRLLMAERRISAVAEEVFADTVIRRSSMSGPLDFMGFETKQRDELSRAWRRATEEADSLAGNIFAALGGITKKSGVTYGKLMEAFSDPMPPAPDISPLLEGRDGGGARRELAGYFAWLARLASVERRGGEEFETIKEDLKILKQSLYQELEAAANTALGWDVIGEIFPLMQEFQEICNRKKREAGILGFNDIAHLAVDALTTYPEIRRIYKRDIRTIMIDEFQDNNSLQRDLVFLLAEDPDRMDPGLPAQKDLSPDRMFFVGDEKQSIYRFRGADVSVFRSLADSFAESGDEPLRAEDNQGRDTTGTLPGLNLRLRYNYRSKPELVMAFNLIFGGIEPSGERIHQAVFLPRSLHQGTYEASYAPIFSPEGKSQEKSEAPPQAPLGEGEDHPYVNFYFLDEDRLSEEEGELTSQEIEAVFIAWKIRRMVDSGYALTLREQDEEITRPCQYGDFAVLQRSYTNQMYLERQFKKFGIPYAAERPGGLFQDAPANDMYQYLRLVCYPSDREAYAAVIRSPFTHLGDGTLAVAMLNDGGVPFDEALEDSIPMDEQKSYRIARERYISIAEAAKDLSLTQLLNTLWYGEAYRYETLDTKEAAAYGELFDLFFELARRQEAKNATLADFLDYLKGLISQEEKLDDLSIPRETSGVRLMSIHKSKGLEFPVVFLYRAGGKGPQERNEKAAYYHERWGVTINAPRAAELPANQGGNLFYIMAKEEENRKQTAELRRLLYVAMTRAECAFLVTGTLPKQLETEKKEGDLSLMEYNDRAIRAKLELIARRAKESDRPFLALLIPALVPFGGEDWSPLFAIRHIPAWTRAEAASLSSGKDERPNAQAASQAFPLYEGAALIPLPKRIPASIAATDLASIRFSAGGPIRESPELPLDRILQKRGLEARDFGNLCHCFLEAKLSKRKPLIPPGIRERLEGEELLELLREAEAMTGSFFASPLGQRCLAAEFRETEFPFLTLAEVNGSAIGINGKIDLLFGDEVIHVTDFKTDRREDVSAHLAQLAVYARAASDIFGKPSRSYIFYLRSGEARDVTDLTRQVNIEALVSDFLNKTAGRSL